MSITLLDPKYIQQNLNLLQHLLIVGSRLFYAANAKKNRVIAKVQRCKKKYA
jgi:hypothetical protein